MADPLITDEAVLAFLKAVVPAQRYLSNGQISTGLAAALGVLGPQTNTDDDEPDAQEIRDSYDRMALKWRGASTVARKAEYHFPADCLAEAAVVLESLTPVLVAHELASSPVVPQTISDEDTELISDALGLLWMQAPARRAELRSLVERHADWLALGGLEP